MGFPSPATDYAEAALTVSHLCGINNNSVVIETSSGYAVIEKGTVAGQGDTLLATFDGRSQFVKLAGSALITEDGDAIEGEALDDVFVHGVVTFTINRVWNGDCSDGVSPSFHHHRHKKISSNRLV